MENVGKNRDKNLRKGIYPFDKLKAINERTVDDVRSDVSHLLVVLCSYTEVNGDLCPQQFHFNLKETK